MTRKWLIAKKISEEFKAQFPEINQIILQLLFNRGLKTQEDIDEFLNPDYGQDIHDPFLFSHMDQAVTRIFQAIEKKEKITVHGDYDADGVCASVILVTTLKELGAEADVYIPHRMSEGYGLNKNTVEELSKNGTQLIITVDCGISSVDEVILASKKGIDVIITDHHEQQPDLPQALAIINPQVKDNKYPFHSLSGSGVAFKLVQGLIRKDKGARIKKGFEKWLLDLVAIGTIGDCVPLTGENRSLVKYGMVVLRKTKHLGLQELVKSTRFSLDKIDTVSISFGIVPRLNAAGRIDHANTAYKLLITKDKIEAQEVAQQLDKTNQERQRVTEKIVEASKKQIGEVGMQKILFASGKDWIVGVVGLVAGRLTDLYARPVIIMGEKKNEVVGSGRSIPVFDITHALIESRDLLERFGGHALACGFTVKPSKLESFKKKMNELANLKIKEKDMVKRIIVDCEIKLDQADWDLIEILDGFEPFGEGNRMPSFNINNLEVVDLQKVGKDNKHLRLVVKQGNTTRKVIAFGFGEPWGDQLKIGDDIDIIFELSVNEWNGHRELQLKLVDIKISK
ncbi:single-stranded-DNA-specific exonuclease RecJ [Patescibacteria group bacterium]|nr:single-stranded-DNA-specific exonuclease RecJ [Patescibacteria group bacterium]MBU0964326.1 single-stranded-DNA-specific exonuclease RecJ [Patescibacteria group bacterium]